MKLHCSAGLLCALALVGCAAPDTGDRAAASAASRTITATRAAVAPVLDGELDDACWQKAKPVTGFLELNSDRPAAFQSSGRVCYDDTHLYIGMKCLMPKGLKPKGVKRPHDGHLFSDDSVEIMIDPGPNSRPTLTTPPTTPPAGQAARRTTPVGKETGGRPPMSAMDTGQSRSPSPSTTSASRRGSARPGDSTSAAMYVCLTASTPPSARTAPITTPPTSRY